LRLYSKFIFYPYFNRVKLGEGGLVVFNIFYSLYAHKELKIVVFETLISFFVMCLLYGLNDYVDRNHDISNPKKDVAFSKLIIQHENGFFIANTLFTILTIFLVSLFLDPLKSIAIILVFAINYTYSKRLKSFPIADILAVSFWGSMFVMLSGKFSLYLICIAGIMTGISHLFQMLTDKSSDDANNIKTTVVALPGSETLLLTILFVILGASLYTKIGCWSLSIAIPFAFYFISRNVVLSWYIVRVFFFICWLGLLTLYYGSF